MRKIFLNDDNSANMTCPECFKTRTVKGADYEEYDGVVRIRLKCPCGGSEHVVLERRKYYRTELDLPGEFAVEGGEKKPMVVKNLSVNGLRMDTGKNDCVKIGEKLTVEFSPEPGGNNPKSIEVVVKNLDGNFAGVEFCRQPDALFNDIIRSYMFRPIQI